MCVAVLVPAGQTLSDEMIRAMHASNRDSWGFGFVQPYAPSLVNKPFGYKGFIRSVKGVSNTDDAIHKYRTAIEADPTLLTSPHLAHFRITTAGQTNHSNAHPFVLDHGAMIHNGHLAGNISCDHSDTAQFARAIRTVVRPGLDERTLAWMGEKIGGSKLVFLWRDGTAQIVNEDYGTHLPDGIWVSNTHWRSKL